MRKIVTVAAAVCLLWLGLGATSAPAQYRFGGGRLGMGRARVYNTGYYDGGYGNYGLRARNRGNGYGYGNAPFAGAYAGSPYYSDSYAGYPNVPTNYYGNQPANNGPLAYGPGGDSRQSFFSPAGLSTRATIRVALPNPNAKVFFDDEATTESGTDRVYNSPTLVPDKSYTYTVRATWLEDGKEVTRTKDAKVQAGRAATVDFRTPDKSVERD